MCVLCVCGGGGGGGGKHFNGHQGGGGGGVRIPGPPTQPARGVKLPKS